MTAMGRPNNVSNPFKNITMKNEISEESIGDKLNRLVNYKGKGNVKFVDRATHNKLGKDGFMKLLAFQLQNQDPMKPMEQKEFSSQLAQFSQLEQLTNMNKNMEKAYSNIPIQNKFFGMSFIGKQVETAGSSVRYTGIENELKLPFYLTNSAKKGLINIYDSKNQLIKQVEFENLPKGGHHLLWDAVGEDGHKITKGDYRFHIKAYDDSMQEFPVETRTKGIVTGVNFDLKEPILTIDGDKQVYLRDIKNFNSISNNNVEVNEEIKDTKGQHVQNNNEDIKRSN